MMRAVQKHTQEPWILLYVKRWLEAPAQEQTGNVVKRTFGTPQGGVISPLLANLFLHYAFDEWMKRNFALNPFERYADDIVVHCRTEEEAIKLKDKIQARLQECKLDLHPVKTKIVYCKDANRKGNSQNEKFDFLGYTFRPRTAKNRFGELFVSFCPAMSDKAKQSKRDDIKSWHKEVKPNESLMEFIRIINPAVSGWINHYGKFHASELWSTMQYIDITLMKWAKKKFGKLMQTGRKMENWLLGIKKRQPNLFKHWQWMQRNDLDRRAV
jgi:RNA-directed DNA polymerase